MSSEKFDTDHFNVDECSINWKVFYCFFLFSFVETFKKEQNDKYIE